MSDYTPTTDEVRRGYAETIDALGGMHLGHLMFDRWLARHDAEVAAKALRSLAAGWENGTWTAPASYVSRWAESEADRIEREAGI